MADFERYMQLVDALATVTEAEQAVSFREFVLSREYCGATGIYDFWLDEIEKLNDPYELILDGSLGGGKSTIANYYLLYRLYKLFIIPNLRKNLGILEESPIHILYFSTSLIQAKISGYSHLSNIVDSSQWFLLNCPRDKNVTSSIKFNNNFEIRYASQESHAISLNVIAFILDEGNFRSGVGSGVDSEYMEVSHMYSQLMDRQMSRFASRTGTLAFGILISSASYQSSFVEKRKQAISGVAKTACITSISYKIRPQNYSKEMFTVFVGTGTIDPQIVENEGHKMALIKLTGYTQAMLDAGVGNNLFVEVPESLRPAYQINCALALQNHSGVPTMVEGRFISNFSVIRKVLYTPDFAWFDTNSVTLSTEDDFQLIDILNITNIQYPERPHSLFLDLSISGDSGGISCVRNDSTADAVFHTHVFTLELIPPVRPAETRLSKVQDFIIKLAEFVNLCNLGSDQAYSKGIRQETNNILNLEDTRLSIDSSDEFHIHWLRSVVEGRTNIINIPKLLKELQDAVHNLKTRKVIRAKGATDDLMQSLIGAFFLSSIYTSNMDFDFHELHRNVIGKRAVKRLTKYLDFK